MLLNLGYCVIQLRSLTQLIFKVLIQAGDVDVKDKDFLLFHA